MNKPRRPTTGAQFAYDVDISYSMASRLRSGHRRPSLELLIRITEKYELDLEGAVRAANAGTFGTYLEKHVFAAEERVAA